VDHDNLAPGFSGWTLRVDKDLDVRLGGVKLRFDGEPLLIQTADSEIRRDGEEMWIADERVEWVQLLV